MKLGIGIWTRRGVKRLSGSWRRKGWRFTDRAKQLRWKKFTTHLRQQNLDPVRRAQFKIARLRLRASGHSLVAAWRAP